MKSRGIVITQQAIDSRLTLLAWEAMFTWKNGAREMHLFYRNNEMAGYCGVIHALGLCGMDGNYGPAQRAVVLSFGSVSRGAVYALRGRGIEEITVYTQRSPYAVHDQVPGCRYGQMACEGGKVVVFDEDGNKRPLIEALAEADVIVNGILQNTDNRELSAVDSHRLADRVAQAEEVSRNLETQHSYLGAAVQIRFADELPRRHTDLPH